MSGLAFRRGCMGLIPTAANKDLSEPVWRLFSKEQVAERYVLPSKTCDAAEQVPDMAFVGLFRLAGLRCAV